MQDIRTRGIAMSLLDQVRKLEQQVVDRLKELEPLTREYEQLRKLAERLGLRYAPKPDDGEREPEPTAAATRDSGRKRAPKPAARRAAKPQAARRAAKPQPARSPARKRAAKGAAKPRAARSTSGQRAAARPGQRQDDVLRLVVEQPGITVRELGERLGVDSTGLYRIVKRLADGGRVRKDGPRVHPVESPTAASATSADRGPEAPAPGDADQTGTDASATSDS
jgi:MarR family protein